MPSFLGSGARFTVRSLYYTTHSTWWNGQMYYNGRAYGAADVPAPPPPPDAYSAILSYADPAECLREHGDSALCEDDTAAIVLSMVLPLIAVSACMLGCLCRILLLRRGGCCGDRSAENRCCGDRCCGGCCDDDDGLPLRTRRQSGERWPGARLPGQDLL